MPPKIMRRAGISKPRAWRWQERFMREGVASLLRDNTRKPGLPPLPPAVIDRVVELTLAEPPGEATHWTGRVMAAANGKASTTKTPNPLLWTADPDHIINKVNRGYQAMASDHSYVRLSK